MITPEEILEMVSEIADIRKKYHDTRNPGNILEKKGELPEYYPGYNRLVKDYRDILVHAERQVFPERLFLEKSPNMGDDEYIYLKENFKNTTLSVFKDFANSVKRAFHEGNWSLTFEEEEGIYERAKLTFKEYVTDQYDIEAFFKSILIDQKLKDSNGILAVKPKLPVIEEETEEGVIRLVDGSRLNEPKVYYYDVERVVKRDEDIIIVETPEKSVVSFQGKDQRIGLVYEAYTKEAIYRVEQIGKYTDYQFQVYTFYQHDLGYIPAFTLGGEPVWLDDAIHYTSPFLVAVDNLDLALVNKNHLEVSKQLTMYPFRVMIGDECDFQTQEGERCNGNGWLNGFNVDGTQYRYTCPECQGSGLKNRPHRGGTMLINSGTNQLAADVVKPSEAIHFAQPSPEALRYVDETIEKDLQRAKETLHMRDRSLKQSTDSNNITATENLKDKEDQFAFVKPISDQVFNLLYDCLWTIGQMRYGDNFKGFQLQKAKTFDFLTKEDHLYNIELAQSIGNPVLIESAISDYLRFTFHAKTDQARLIEIIKTADRLFAMKQEDIVRALGRTVEPWEMILHNSAFYFIDQLMLEDEKFLSMELSEQVEALQNLAKEKANSLSTNNQNSLINQVLNPIREDVA